MCLRANTQKPAPIKNFSVWKILEINDSGRLVTPNRKFPVAAGKLVAEPAYPKSVPHLATITWGVIHVYTTAVTAKRRQCAGEIIVRCVVRASEFVAWGNNYDAAVTKLRISQTAIANAIEKHAEWMRKDLNKGREKLVANYVRNKHRLQKAKRELAK